MWLLWLALLPISRFCCVLILISQLAHVIRLFSLQPSSSSLVFAMSQKFSSQRIEFHDKRKKINAVCCFRILTRLRWRRRRQSYNNVVEEEDVRDNSERRRSSRCGFLMLWWTGGEKKFKYTKRSTMKHTEKGRETGKKGFTELRLESMSKFLMKGFCIKSNGLKTSDINQREFFFH